MASIPNPAWSTWALERVDSIRTCSIIFTWTWGTLIHICRSNHEFWISKNCFRNTQAIRLKDLYKSIWNLWIKHRFLLVKIQSAVFNREDLPLWRDVQSECIVLNELKNDGTERVKSVQLTHLFGKYPQSSLEHISIGMSWFYQNMFHHFYMDLRHTHSHLQKLSWILNI